ncbi:MAG TPA: hypothetical protein VEJ84_13520 [Acidimicrobiales bacterium]|nr:hypothetical protein [Acidimicrobiales bacterium]
MDDIQAAYKDALEAGAHPLHAAGPVRIDGGPNEGAWAVYVRVPPDNHTFELWQRRGERPEGQQSP